MENILKSLTLGIKSNIILKLLSNISKIYGNLNRQKGEKIGGEI